MLKRARQDSYKIRFVSALVSKGIFFPLRKKEASVVFLEQITFNLFFIFSFIHMNEYWRSSCLYIQTSIIFLFKKICEVLLLQRVILFQTKYKTVPFFCPTVWLSFVLSLDSRSSSASWNFASEAWISFPFFHKNEMQNKTWFEVKSRFPSLSSSNRYRLFKAKAC